MTILVHISVQDGQVKRAALEVLSRCREIAQQRGGTVAVAIIAPDARQHIETVQRYGPQQVYCVSNPIFNQPLNVPLLAAMQAVIEKVQPDVVAFASSETVKDVLGALSARLEAPALPDVAAFEVQENGVEAVRPVMASKFLARTRAVGKPVLVSVRSGAYAASEAQTQAEVMDIPFSFNESDLKATLREVVQATGGGVDLSEASVVVAAGRGVRDEDGKKLVEDLAGLFNGAIGASRAVVETGMFPATAQVGQTGKVVSPEIYFAIGISGAIQHAAGMMNSRTIIAINKDPDAPIFRYATYGLVGDLYKILPSLIEEIRKSRK